MAQPAPTSAVSTLLTVEEFMAYDFPSDIGKAELVRGELRMTPLPAARHGVVIANLLVRLGAHVRSHGLGRVFGDTFGYVLVELPRTIRAPDVSFVRADRLPPDGFHIALFHGAPDLAVEVLSPSDRDLDLQEKLYDYGLSDTSQIWIVDPETRTVTVLSPGTPARELREGDTLDGGDVIPAFTMPVLDIFEGIAR